MWWAILWGMVVSLALRLWRQYVVWGKTQSQAAVLILNAVGVFFVLRALNLNALFAFIVAVGASFALYELALKRVFGKGAAQPPAG